MGIEQEFGRAARILRKRQALTLQDWKDWLPDWAKEAKAKKDGNGQAKQEDKLGKALAELSDEALARIILLASAEQQERDLRRKLAEPGA